MGICSCSRCRTEIVAFPSWPELQSAECRVEFKGPNGLTDVVATFHYLSLKMDENKGKGLDPNSRHGPPPLVHPFSPLSADSLLYDHPGSPDHHALCAPPTHTVYSPMRLQRPTQLLHWSPLVSKPMAVGSLHSLPVRLWELPNQPVSR